MRSGLAVGASLWLASQGWACDRRWAPPPSAHRVGGEVARVGDVSIPSEIATEVARSRAVSQRTAVRFLVEDALAAQAARKTGLDGAAAVRWASEAALARVVAAHVADEALARGAPSDDELATLRVIHAVALRSPTVSLAAVKATAEAIAEATSGARDAEDFEARASRAAYPDVRVAVERLPEFDVAGRTQSGGELDARFVAASFALPASGATSGVIESVFGWHVIRLVARLPPDRGSAERLRQELAGPVVGARARARLDVLVRERRLRVRPQVSVAAGDLMALAGEVATSPQ